MESGLRRIPAFGDWNYSCYRRDGAVVHDWPPVTPCFDFASGATRTAARQNKSTTSNKRSTVMPNARRMRVPAFGEWNHHGDGGNGSGDGIGSGAWPAVMSMTPFFDLAAPPPQKAPKTAVGTRRGRADGGFDDSAGKLALATAAEAAPQGHVQTRRSKVADSGAYAAAVTTARRSCFTVPKPVDDDLYGVPPDMMLDGNNTPGARKDGWRRILRLLGCCCCLSASS